MTNEGSNFNQWGPNSSTTDYQVTIGTEVPSSEIIENSATKAYYINVPNSSYNYIFKTKAGGNLPDPRGLIVFEVQGTVRSVSSVSKDLSTIYPGQAVVVTATLDGALSGGQGVYLRYTNDAFSTSTVVQMTGSGTSYSATIPSGVNSSSKTVTYYVFTSGSGLTISGSNADFYTINMNTNGGSNYSYTVQSTWITAADGNWSNTATWLGGVVPPDNQPVTIDHAVTLDQNATVSSCTINSSKSLTSQSSTARTLTISSGGTFTNNGTFTANNGKVLFSGSGTINGTTETSFNNVDLNGATTFSTTPSFNYLLLYSGYSISGNPPNFPSNSKLEYSTGISTNRGLEWTDASSGAGFPSMVVISAGTTLNMGTTVAYCGGTLQVGEGSSLNTTSNILTVGGDVIVDGTISLGGDMKVKGNWKIGSAATQSNNNKAVFFTGTVDQTITKLGGGTVYFDYLILDKPSGNLILSSSPATDVVINTTTGEILQLNNSGPLDLNGRSLTLNNNGGNISVNDPRNVNSTVSGGSLVISGSKSVTGSGTLTLGSNVTVKLANGINFGASKTTLNGTLQINANGFVDVNAPIYGTGSLLQYNSGANPYDRKIEWNPGATSGPGYPYHVRVSSNTTLNVGGTVLPVAALNMGGDLTIDAGSGFYMDYGNADLSVPVVVAGNLIINGNLSLSGNYSGDLKLAGYWTRSATGVFTPNDRAVFFNGSAGQTISANNGETFDYFIVDKPSGEISLSSNITINDTLTLSSGLITTGINKVTIPAGGGIKNATSASYVNGFLAQTFTTTGSKTFPIGKGGNYRPLKFRYNTLTGTSQVTTSQVESAIPGTIPTGVYLIHNRYWNISHTATGSFNYQVTLDGSTFTEGGSVVILKKESGNITDHPAQTDPAHPYYKNSDGFNTLIDTNGFTFGLDCKNVVANAGRDTTLCTGQNVTLNANNPAPGSGQWSIISGPSTSSSQLSSTTAHDPLFTPAGGTGTYVLRWVVSFLTCPNDTDFVTVRVGNVEVNATAGKATACYLDLKTAFDSLKTGYHQGSIIVKLNGNVTETATARLVASGDFDANYTSVLIYPTASGVEVTGDLASPLIELNGADQVTLDGRVNATGSAKDLQIYNAASTGPGSAIRLTNGASNNIIQYCRIRCDSTSATGGIITLSPSTGSSGNNYNLITHNDIYGGTRRPVNAVYSEGTDVNLNSLGSIVDNHIFNFLNPYVSSNGIHLNGYNQDWDILGNSLYETSESFIAKNNSNITYTLIRVQSPENTGFSIESNYLGGNAPNCTGTFVKRDRNTAFAAITVDAFGATINSNRISHFDWSNSGNASWSAIHTKTGQFTLSGNLIGAESGTNNILLTNAASNGYFYGFSNESDDNVIITGNSIGSITTDNVYPEYSTHITCISNKSYSEWGAYGYLTVSNNMIGGTGQSIQANSKALSFTQKVIGIHNFNDYADGITINNNRITFLTNYTENTSSLQDTAAGTCVMGILSESGSNVIDSNIISNLTIYGGVDVAYNSAAIGINLAFAETYNNIISRNEIFDLVNENPSGKINVIGLYYDSDPYVSSNMIEKNFIHGLVNASQNSAATTTGMFQKGGRSDVVNNIVTIPLTGSDVTNYGIFVYSGQGSFNFNTICLKGASSGQDYGFYLHENNQGNITNNIFYVDTTGAGQHYAINSTGNTGTIDYNDYIGQVEGDFGVHSRQIDPDFNYTTGDSLTEFIPQADQLYGDTNYLTIITKDIDDDDRCLPTMGAQEDRAAESIVTFNSADTVRCQGADTVTYTATATFSYRITYSLDPVSIAGGLTINSLTGTVIYPASWTGTSVVSAISKACNPDTAFLAVLTEPSTPTFTPPDTLHFCVENIDTASFFEPTTDITPDRPEYYRFLPGDVDLNLDTTTFSDICCSDTGFTIHWKILFQGGGLITGTGQPSMYNDTILFPGDGITFNTVQHTIRYWLTDCNDNASAEIPVPIFIHPRPNVIKDP